MSVYSYIVRRPAPCPLIVANVLPVPLDFSQKKCKTRTIPRKLREIAAECAQNCRNWPSPVRHHSRAKRSLGCVPSFANIPYHARRPPHALPRGRTIFPHFPQKTCKIRAIPRKMRKIAAKCIQNRGNQSFPTHHHSRAKRSLWGIPSFASIPCHAR